MNELLSSLITEEMRMALVVVCVMIAALYVLSIVWVVRDAYQRGAQWTVWGIVAIIPIVGLVAYCLLRPPLLQLDRDEQELEIAYKQRALQKYGNCAVCGCPVEDDFIVCPSCHTPLKNQCARCGRPLDPVWSMCPYCATPVNNVSARSINNAPARRRSVRTQERSVRSERNERNEHGELSAADDNRTVAMDMPKEQVHRRRVSAE